MSIKQSFVGGAPAATLYSDDVFSTYLYTGATGSQTITNGIDLAGQGGMVWFKQRSGTGNSNILCDTARGTRSALFSDTTAAVDTANNSVTAFNSNGVTFGGWGSINGASETYASWTFRKAPKFFDVVTYTGNGVAGRTISHNLGVAPGMIIVKRISSTANWCVQHRSLAATENIYLNLTDAKYTSDTWYNTAATSTHFTVNNYAENNGNGDTYVAYLFAHDSGTDGIIQAGSFTTDGSGNATVNLGWEPQWVLIKTFSAGSSTGWIMMDQMRGWNMGSDSYLLANTSGAEGSGAFGNPTATGFAYSNDFNTGHIYLAIRRPNKPPTSGTQVYNAIARTGTGAAATVTGVGFAPDLVIPQNRNTANGTSWFSRLQGATKLLLNYGTNAEITDANSLTGFDKMDGVSVGTDATNAVINYNTNTYINHFFRRAPGVFDVVCDTGTGSAHTVSHGLGVVPELIIRKERNNARDWVVYIASQGNNYFACLNDGTFQGSSSTMWNDTDPTASVFTVGTNIRTNTNTATYVAYLFATKAGISKVGSYTGGNGNLLLYSEDFRNTAEAGLSMPWAQYVDGDTSVSQDTVTGPFGGTTVSKLKCATTGAVQRQVSQAPAGLIDNTVYCASVYAKAGEVSRLTILMATKAPTYPAVTFNLSVGSVSSTSGAVVASGVTAVGGGWYRCWAAFNVLSGATAAGPVYQLRSTSDTNYSGAVGDGLYLFGAQVNIGSSPTDYVRAVEYPAQRIDCGFSAGARFVLIKRTDSSGDWYVWDSARGIVAGNDPHLSLNTTAAEVTTDDSVDPDNSGFIVNQLAATNINVTSATYIYLAFA